MLGRRFLKYTYTVVEILEITLWECNSNIIRACEIALYEALKKIGLKAVITVNSEPPLIARNQLWDRLPVLEIQGLYFSLHPGRPFSVDELVRLFKVLFPDLNSEIRDQGSDGNKNNLLKYETDK